MFEIEQLTQPREFPNFNRNWRYRPQEEPTYYQPQEEPKPKKKTRAERVPEDEETVRRRDILVSVAVLGELEYYVGEKIEPAKIRLMKKDKLDTLFAAYETKLGHEMTENGMETIVGSAVKLLTWFIPVDDKEALKQYLLDNKPLRRSLGRHCAGMAERYGDILAFSKVAYDVMKQIKLEDKEEPKKDSLAETSFILIKLKTFLRWLI